MPTQAEEQQVKEFLSRAQVRTMRKDLQKLREADAVKERDKIVKVKTLEEQLQEQAKKKDAQAQALQAQENQKRDTVLQSHATEERKAAQSLKEYATEQERQQIFLLESQRLQMENQVKDIDEKKSPAIKLQKNNILIESRGWEQKLSSAAEQEAKLQSEQKFIAEKEQATTLPAEKKSLEQRKWELDEQIQKIEKGRWELEKNIAQMQEKVKQADKLADQLQADRNGLNQKILGIDKSLRDVYSAIMAREEEKRRGKAAEQMQTKEAAAKVKAAEKETIQRQQWTGKQDPAAKEFLRSIPLPAQQKIAESAKIEEEQRKKFIENVEKQYGQKDN